MTFSDKLTSINTTSELINFIQSIDHKITFTNGRKFSFGNGEAFVIISN